MRTLTRNCIASPFFVAIILAAGTLTAWIFISGLLVSIVHQWTQPALYEYFVVNKKSEVFVEQLPYDGAFRIFRTLDGQPVADSKNIDITNYGVALPSAHSGQPENFDWAQRIVGFFNTEVPPVLWYLCHDGKPNGHAYFIGYNNATMRLTGYIGLDGFRSDVPTEEERFPMDLRRFVNRASFTGPSNPAVGREPYPISLPYYWMAYVAASGKLWAIDLNRRAVNPFKTDGDVVSAQTGSERMIDESGGYTLVIVRTPQSLSILNIKGELLKTLPIPEAIRPHALRLFNWWTPNPVMIDEGWRRGEESTICWLDDKGNTTKQSMVEIVPFRTSVNWDPWSAPVVLPTPLPLAYVLFVAIPKERVSAGIDPDVVTARSRLALVTWSALAAICLLSVILGIVSYRHCYRYSYSHHGAAAWAFFVLLTGAPGFVGYLLHRRWPVMERCANCGIETPRDRHSCLACAAEFPPPPLKGIEVFA